MSLEPEYFQTGATWLNRRDPRWRLLGFAVALLGVATLREPGPLAAALLVASVVLFMSGAPGRWWRPRVFLIVLAIVPFLLLVPFSVSRGRVLVTWHIVTLTDAGLVAAGTLALRTLALALLGLALAGAAPLPTTFAAAGRLGVPRLLVTLVALTHRYIWVLLEEWQRLRRAVRVRGFRNAPSLHAFRTIGQAMGWLILRGADRADRVAQAMRCRGFTGRFPTLHVMRTTPGDVAWLLGVSAVFGALTAWDRVG